MSKDEDLSTALGGCIGIGLVWVFLAVMAISFWVALIWGALAGLQYFGVIG